jgi:hypothetical protein
MPQPRILKDDWDFAPPSCSISDVKQIEWRWAKVLQGETLLKMDGVASIAQLFRELPGRSPHAQPTDIFLEYIFSLMLCANGNRDEEVDGIDAHALLAGYYIFCDAPWEEKFAELFRMFKLDGNDAQDQRQENPRKSVPNAVHTISEHELNFMLVSVHSAVYAMLDRMKGLKYYRVGPKCDAVVEKVVAALATDGTRARNPHKYGHFFAARFDREQLQTYFARCAAVVKVDGASIDTGFDDVEQIIDILRKEGMHPGRRNYESHYADGCETKVSRSAIPRNGADSFRGTFLHIHRYKRDKAIRRGEREVATAAECRTEDEAGKRAKKEAGYSEEGATRFALERSNNEESDGKLAKTARKEAMLTPSTMEDQLNEAPVHTNLPTAVPPGALKVPSGDECCTQRVLGMLSTHAAGFSPKECRKRVK